MTRLMMPIAKDAGGKVLVIDPFEEGWSDMPPSYGEPYPYSIFHNSLKTYIEDESLILFKCPSNDPSLPKKLVQHSPIRFAYVDGLQYKEAVLEDLCLMQDLRVPYVIVDDYTRETEISQVPLAVKEFLETSDYELLGTGANPLGQGRVLAFLRLEKHDKNSV